MIKWYIGCSGFHYKHWKGTFYPDDLPQRLWFDYYCRHFNTLELNVTFYRFPELSFVQGWYKKSPANFRFAVKAPRAITHFKKFNDASKLIHDFYDTIQKGLKEKLGPVLFQLPPRYDYSEERLEKIINNLDASFHNVVEFRHASWWNENVYRQLAKNNISFCGMSHPELPRDIIQNTKLLYYRMHGIPDLYRSPYKLTTLKDIIDEIESSAKIKKAFIYFNNDIDVSAIRNAKEMVGLVGGGVS